MNHSELILFLNEKIDQNNQRDIEALHSFLRVLDRAGNQRRQLRQLNRKIIEQQHRIASLVVRNHDLQSESRVHQDLL